MILSSFVRVWWFTLYTIVLISPFAGADIITFLAPAFKWRDAFSLSVKCPVHSSTTSTAKLAHGNSSGLVNDVIRVFLSSYTK